MKKEKSAPKTREQLFAEKAEKSYAICYTQTCPLRSHCLRWQLQSYTPKDRRITYCINLNNPAMQTEACPMYRNDQPIRMPLGIAKMYYDMPQRIAHPLKSSSSISTANVTTNTTAATNPCLQSMRSTSVRPSAASAGSNPSNSTPTLRITYGKSNTK